MPRIIKNVKAKTAERRLVIVVVRSLPSHKDFVNHKDLKETENLNTPLRHERQSDTYSMMMIRFIDN
jgi:hypothetical protein